MARGLNFFMSNKRIFSLLILLFLLLALVTGCTWLKQPMTGATLRIALDECTENNLDVLVYSRTDNSIMAVRCIPKPDQVAKTVRVRPYAPLKILRPSMQIEEIIE